MSNDVVIIFKRLQRIDHLVRMADERRGKNTLIILDYKKNKGIPIKR